MARSFGSRFSAWGSFVALAMIFVSGTASIGALNAVPAAHAGTRDTLAAPVFPGPLRGTPSRSAPTPASFAYTCNVRANTVPAKAAGTTLESGTAIQDIGGCGQAVLFLNGGASGHFQAKFAVADTATSSSSVLRLFLLGSDGSLLRTMDVTATKGTASRVDFDVSGGVTLALTFPKPADSFVYGIVLAGSARALAMTPVTASGLPLGGIPVPAASMQLGCNASASSQPSTVSAVAISATESLQMEGCGKITVRVPASAKGALALRYGLNDISNYSSLDTQVGLRVLDSTGLLLRKSIGLVYIGSGFQPIWVNVQGGSTVTFTMDGGNTNVQLVVAGISFLPAAVTPHHNPDHQEFGSPSGGSIPIAPDAVVGICNANLGTTDTTVAHQSVLRDNYLAVEGCGLAELIMTNAHGTFSAKVGIADSSTGKTLAVHMVVLDQNSKPLSTKDLTVSVGAPGKALGASITGASIVQISFTGNANGILYDLRLTGQATLYDRVFPPSEPPASTAGGVVINPSTLDVTCNVGVTKQDYALIHQVALEQWSIYVNGCGAATLNVATLHGPHKTFSVLYGIALQDQKNPIAHMQLAVLDAKGKTVRQETFVARAGYGPRRAAISLAGGAKLQITGPDHPLVVFALTVA